MNGTWIIKTNPPHVCSPPFYSCVMTAWDFGLGSVWQCGCGLKWKFEKAEENIGVRWMPHDR